MLRPVTLLLFLCLVLGANAAPRRVRGATRTLNDDCPQEARDCMGVCDGLARVDCLGQCNGPATLDLAGTCCGPESMDCAGYCYGLSKVDDCGVCGGNNVDKDANGQCCPVGQKDCMGVCGGSAKTDDCGVCNGNNAGKDVNGQCCTQSQKDCEGICFGPKQFDNCGVCDGDSTSCCGPSGDCHGNGECSEEYQTCLCKFGWTGAFCNVEQDACADVDCGHGSCRSVEGRPVCDCQMGWGGERCEEVSCNDRGYYNPEIEQCTCLTAFDPEHRCGTCTTPPEGEMRVCLGANDTYLPLRFPTTVAKVMIAAKTMKFHSRVVDIFPPESIWGEYEYDCGCIPVNHIVKAIPLTPAEGEEPQEETEYSEGEPQMSATRFTQMGAENSFSTIFGKPIKSLDVTNAMLEELTNKSLNDRDKDIFWPVFGQFLIHFVGVVVIVIGAVVSVGILMFVLRKARARAGVFN